MKTTIAETYDFFTVMRARKKIGLEKDTEVFTLGIGRTAVGYLAVVILTETDIYDGYTDDFTAYLEKESNKEYYKKISVDFSDTKIKRRKNKYGYLQYMDRTDSLYRCVIFGERVGAVLGDEIIVGRLCLSRRHPDVENLDQRLFEFVENLRFDGSGKQLTALRGEGSKKRPPSKTAPAAATSGIDQQAGLAARSAVPIDFERDRPQIIKAIREYYDGPGESYDHPTSALGGTMGKIMTLTRLGSAGDQIEVKAEYTWVPNSVIHGMELPHDGKFVLKKEGGAYKVVKMWSKNFGWK